MPWKLCPSMGPFTEDSERPLALWLPKEQKGDTGRPEQPHKPTHSDPTCLDTDPRPMCVCVIVCMERGLMWGGYTLSRSGWMGKKSGERVMLTPQVKAGGVD